MKAIWILCNESISEDVIDLLEKDGVEGYTVWDNVLGCHHGCKTHWNNAVFPGRNRAFFIAGEDGAIAALTAHIRQFKLRGEIHRAGLKAFVQPIEEEV